MAHDSFMFREGAIDIRSDFLSWVLRQLDGYAQTHASDDSWLARAIAEWHAECEYLPTGFRLLKLDQWLTSGERCAEFLAAIAWTRQEMFKAIATGEIRTLGLPLERYLDELMRLVASNNPSQ